ncbi:uncharacterized protein LDX57_001360 [Aspergillus melleus]|uniref:uncharacterized protein n=1 Tax=Aspergillus melleus TaxID=138277 RepID=UPI001E8ED07E|nr:uncharacterized protein LDX57_001360 [Aspergillus melleus]KAH8423600.1 hypothetical protein LDX57_001360 [Aspergillus melleus]
MSGLPTEIPREQPSPGSIAQVRHVEYLESDFSPNQRTNDNISSPGGSGHSPDDSPSQARAMSPSDDGDNSSAIGGDPPTPNAPRNANNVEPRIAGVSGSGTETWDEDNTVSGKPSSPLVYATVDGSAAIGSQFDVPSPPVGSSSPPIRPPSWRARPASPSTGNGVRTAQFTEPRPSFRPFRSGREVRSPTPLARGARLGSRGFQTGIGRSQDWNGSLNHAGRGRSDLASFVQGIKPEFALVLNGGLPNGVVTLKEAQQGMKNQRLRIMPHRASRSDRILHRADGLAEVVDEFISSLRSADPAVADCSTIMFTSFKHLTLLISRRSNSAVLEEAFIALDQVALILKHFAQHMHCSSRIISDISIQALILLVKLDLEILKTVKNTRSSAAIEFGPPFEIHLKEFLQIEDKFSTEVWRVTIERSQFGDIQGTSVETIRSWLSVEERNEQITKFHGFSSIASPGTELPLRWLSDLTTKFWQSSDSMLFITGEAGCGKSTFIKSTVDRSKARYSRGAKVLFFSIEPSLRGRRTSTDLVKSLLLQLFDRSVGDASFFKSLHDVYFNRGDDEERRLWSILQQQAFRLMTKSPGEELLLVIDGLDKIEGDKVQVRTLLHDVVKKHQSHRCIIFSRPVFDGNHSPDCVHYEITSNVLRDDIRYLVKTRIEKISWLRNNVGFIQLVTERALQLGSLITAHLLVSLLESQESYREAIIVLKSIPTTPLGLIDFMIMRVNFEEPLVKNLLTWLLVSERVMAQGEIETMLDPRFIAGSFNIHASEFLHTSCASLIEIQEGLVQFIHPLIKERFLQLGRESIIPLSPRSAHQVALWRCLEYIKHRLPDIPEINLTLAEPDIRDQQISHVSNDTLLEYSILHYMKHYDEGRWETTSDFRRAYLDSPLLAQCERYYWGLNFDGAILEQRHFLALNFRRAVFGGRSLSIVQNLITLSTLYQTPEHRGRTLAYLNEAWSLAIKLMGRDASICRDLALKYSEIYIGGPGIKVDVDPSEELLEFVWDVERTRFGPMSEQAIVQVNILIMLYKSKERHDQVASLQYHLYEMSAQAYGRSDNRTISYASSLVDVLIALGNYHEASIVCKDLFQAMGDDVSGWDSCRREIFFRLIDCYESQGQHIQAQEVLRSSWEKQDKVCFTSGSLEARLTFVQTTTRLGRLLINDAKLNEASDIVTELYEVLKRDSSFFDQDTLHELLSLIDSYIQNGLFSPVNPILVELRSICCVDLTRETSIMATRVSILLSKCYRHNGRHAEARTFVEELFRRFVAMEILDKYWIDVATELVDIDKGLDDGFNAMLTCQTVLQVIWPSLLIRDQYNLTVPIENTESAIRMALVFANLVVTQKPLPEAEDILRFIFQSFRDSDNVKDGYIFEVVDLYTEVLHRTGRVHEAISVLQELRSRFRENYGTRDQYNCISSKLITLFQMTDIQNVSESILIQFIESFEDGEGISQSTYIDAVLVLIKFYEAHGRSAELRSWYGRIWNFITLYHRSGHSGDITEKQIFEALHGYSTFLLSRNQPAEAIRINQHLRTFISRGSTWAIVADYELAKCFEQTQDYSAAVNIYEDVCRTGDEISDAEEIINITQCATDRLLCLYARDSNLIRKAEEMLHQRWETTRRIQGISHSKTDACFQKIADFHFQEHFTDKSLTWMEEYVVQIMIEENDEKRLLNWASKFYDAYYRFNVVDPGLKLVRDLRVARAFVSNSANDFVQRIGQSRILLIDRRSFVLVNALEKLLKGEPQPLVLHDIMQEVLRESALYESWSTAKHMQIPLETRLVISSRLMAFLKEQGRLWEQKAVVEETLTLFQSYTQSNSSLSELVRPFLEEWLGELHRGNSSVSFLSSLTGICIDLNRKQHYADCLVFTKWAYDCLKLRSWGSQTREFSRIGFSLVREIQMGTPATSDLNQAEMKSIADKIIVALIYPGGKPESGGRINIADLQLNEINILIRILIEKRQLSALEEIFQSLWDARVCLDDWHLGTTISIGLRLCKVKFARQRSDEAQELVTDILYNLLDVYGEESLNPLIVQCKNLYASFLRAEGDYSNAFEVHWELLEKAVGAYSHSETPSRQDTDTQNWGATVPETKSDVMFEQLRFLKSTYELNGGWEGLGEEYYMPLLEAAYDLGARSTAPERWKSVVQEPSTWVPRQTEESIAENVLGRPEQPDNWTIPETMEGDPLPSTRNHGHDGDYYGGNAL